MLIIANEWYQFVRKSDWFEMWTKIILWVEYSSWELKVDIEDNYEQVEYTP